MYRFAVLIVAVTLLSGYIAQVASCQMTSGTIVDPILDRSVITHSHSGANLEPDAYLSEAILTNANLYNA